MSGKRWTELFKIEAVKHVTERGYNKRPTYQSDEISMVAPNLLSREFDVQAPNLVWVPDITFTRTCEGMVVFRGDIGFVFQAVHGLVNEFADQHRADIKRVGDGVLATNAKCQVIVHSDQGCQYTSNDWNSTLKKHDLVPRMSCRGNCQDTAVAERGFQLLKRERIKRKVYASRVAGKQDNFDCIELILIQYAHLATAIASLLIRMK